MNDLENDYQIENIRKIVAKLYGCLGCLVEDKSRLLKSNELFEAILENCKLDHFKKLDSVYQKLSK
ncbi:MAG: hypothetical protein WCK98_04020 [bacterium]